jgi:hypothetical protein
VLNEIRASASSTREQDGAAATGQAIVVEGAFTAGASQIFTAERERSLHGEDVATITMGGQTIRIGGRAKANWIDVLDSSNFGGTFTFANLTDFGNQRPIQFTVRRGEPEASFSEVDAGVFAEIDSRPFDSVGIVAGVRYDWQSTLTDLNNLAPRVSIAFAPAGQSFVIRGGAGVFYQSLSESAIARSRLFGPSGLQETTITAPPFPLPPSASPFQGASLSAWQLDRELRAPMTTQATIGVERLLWRRTTLVVEYLHLRTSGAFRARDLNAPLPGSGLRPDPARLNVHQIESTGSSQTHAMTATFRGYIGGFKGSAQYTLSRTTDDTSGVFDLPANNYNLAAERGPSDFDRRHKFSLAGTYEWAQDRMRLAALLTVASGAPFDITTGSDDNRDSIVNDRPVGITRNMGRGPGPTQLDLRLTGILRAPRPRSADPESTKREYIDNLDLNLDVFNVLSASNPTSVVGVITSPLFGKPSAVRSPRAMQLSLRYRF